MEEIALNTRAPDRWLMVPSLPESANRIDFLLAKSASKTYDWHGGLTSLLIAFWMLNMGWIQGFTSIAALSGLTTILGIALAWANRALHVEEDPRIDQVDELLPQANCGACGFPGCRAFAEALVDGRSEPAKCTVGSDEGRAAVARLLGVDVGEVQRNVARLACAGGLNTARQYARYKGLDSCRAAAQVAGGGKDCAWGCLGLGDCFEVCDFDAIHMSAFKLPVVSEANCTACNACVEICPRDLFTLQPIDRRLWVACRNFEAGDRVLESCSVGCTACGRCAADGPSLISMKNNLPVVDYAVNHDTKVPTLRCPTGSIVWLSPQGPETGPAAPSYLRKQPRPIEPR